MRVGSADVSRAQCAGEPTTDKKKIRARLDDRSVDEKSEANHRSVVVVVVVETSRVDDGVKRISPRRVKELNYDC